MNEGFLKTWAHENAVAVRWDRAERADVLGLSFDTRTIDPGDPKPLVFAALKGDWRDGHAHLAEAHERGIRLFMVQEDPGPDTLPDSAVIVVQDTLLGLQQLTGAWRMALPVQVIGITGSNGKTIVKEWLSTLLGTDLLIYRSPRSFNSQLGVAVSLWGLRPEHELALIEVGISEPGEMAALERCVRPDFGVLTHLGEAHIEAFPDAPALMREKIALFRRSQWVVMPHNLSEAAAALRADGIAVHQWGPLGDPAAQWQWTDRQPADDPQSFVVAGRGVWHLPARGEMAFRNALTALAAAWAIGKSSDAALAQRMMALRDIDMRMQRLQTPEGCWVLSDAWTNDWGALTLALEDLRNLPEQRPKALVLGPLPNMDSLTAERLGQLASSERIHRVWLVGEGWADMDTGSLPTQRFAGVDDVLQHLRAQPNALQGHDVLVKGPRRAAFERISDRLIRHGHATTLTIDLEAVTQNLRILRHHVQAALDKPVEFLAVVKASAYGASAVAISHALRRQGVRRFAVACTEEGVELRQSGIDCTIVVFNPDPGTFAALVDHDLEPEVHDLAQIQALIAHLRTRPSAQRSQPYPVHLKVDTGMHRLGFATSSLQTFLDAWKSGGWADSLRIESVFSHLASADDPSQDAFTAAQIRAFDQAVSTLRAALGNAQPLRSHILNSAGAIRFPHAGGDWIRLGIALYGIAPETPLNFSLHPALSFETVVSAIRDLPPGEGLGYGHTDAAPRPRRIATLPVGYADGWPRHLSHGKGWVVIHGQRAPVVGKVCMDMTLVDVTDIEAAQSGDEVLLFGLNPTVEEVANAAGTIPYEILSRIPPRVRRLQKGS